MSNTNYIGLRYLNTILIVIFITIGLNAQNFGKNKVVYGNFNFKVLETPTFSINYYLKNQDKLHEIGKHAEIWNKLHEAILMDTLPAKNPIILYSNHADFQQTNTINSEIGVGTGGVTEAFKKRVIIPLTFTNQQNYHVLGHELVHAFQYNLILNGDSTSMRSFQNLPLWMVEGMAEYLSKGRNDSYTSMWMRDAVINNDIPEIKKLDYPEYFPYRYGQAFWSFITGTYGDEALNQFFKNTAIFGLDIAIDSTFKTSKKELSEKWVNSIKSHYKNFIKYDKVNSIGQNIISEKNAGEMNVSPAISPNGKYVIFISEKDVFTTDWYLANANNGKIIKKISSRLKDANIDDYNFLESSGTWSPKSDKFAFVAFEKGRNIIVIKDAETGKTISEHRPKDLHSFTNPLWSPDGNFIVLTGLQEGQTDLFSYHLKTGKLNKITDDKYSEIHSDFSSDGKNIVFATDEISMKEGMTNGKWVFNIAVLNVETGKKSHFRFFKGADNLNPVFDAENNIYFLSDRDGFRNMYMYETSTGKIIQKTDIMTGISGVTEYSPAISLSKKTDRIVYTLYYDKQYSMYQAKSEKFLNKEVAPDDVDMRAGTLPKPEINSTDLVNNNLKLSDKLISEEKSDFIQKAYRPHFKLDYIGGGTGIGIGNSTFGTSSGMAGGVDMLFSDMLGNHQLFSRLAINGEIYDFGGQFVYMNRQSRINWGAGLVHVPYSLGYYESPVYETIGNVVYLQQTTNLLRIFDERLSLFAHYPFSTRLRLEGGIDGGYRSFRADQIKDYYYPFYPYDYAGQDREKIPVGDTIGLGYNINIIKGFSSSLNMALVGDNSFNGLTSPLSGYKYRLGVEKYFGADNYYSTNIDARYYYWLKPVSFAFRALSYFRFEKDVNSVYPVYIGQMGLVRGYNYQLFSNYVLDNNDFYYDQLFGSKVLMGNFEIRLPFTGIERLSLIKSRFLMSDLAAFFDIGVAFDEFSHFKDGERILTKDTSGIPVETFRKPKIAKSAGVALRVNLFGALIIEPYFAYPFETNSKFIFGLNLMPGF